MRPHREPTDADILRNLKIYYRLYLTSHLMESLDNESTECQCPYVSCSKHERTDSEHPEDFLLLQESKQLLVKVAQRVSAAGRLSQH